MLRNSFCEVFLSEKKRNQVVGCSGKFFFFNELKQ